MAWSGTERPVPEILQIAAGGEHEEERARFRDSARRALLRQLAEPDGFDIPEENPWERILNYRYPWESITREKTVYSVSELKHAAADSWREAHGAVQQRGPVVTVEDAEGKDREYAGREAASDGSGQTAADRGTESGGAFRGTAYHKALELLSPSLGADIPEISRQLDALVQEGSLSREERRTIRSDKLAVYFGSRLGQIAARAGQEGRLHREQTFVMQVPLSEILPVETDEWVVVQGIIDAWAETEEGIILWDYKTDALPAEGGEEYLRGMYAEQLRRYRDALERGRGRKVTEMWLYSFTLDKEIRV